MSLAALEWQREGCRDVREVSDPRRWLQDPTLHTVQLLTAPRLSFSLSVSSQSGKTKGGYGHSGIGYPGTFEKVDDGLCVGQSFLPFPLFYDGLIFKFIEDEPTQDLCQTTCSGVGGPGFRGYNYVIENEDIDCVCYFDDGLVPDCPRNDVGSHSGWSSKPASPASFVCAKSELGLAFGPISGASTFGTNAECYRAVNSYGGKSGKSKGSGYSGYHGKSGKGYYKSGLSFEGEGFCRDSSNKNYDAVWFILAGLDDGKDGKEPGLGLCEAKCKSPPSYNPDIEHVSY